MERRVLGEALQPLHTEPPAHGGSNGERHHERHGVAHGEEAHDRTNRRTHHLANAYLLAAILGLEHRQREHTYNGDDDADDGEELHLRYEAELLDVGLLQVVVEEVHLVLLRRVETVEHVGYAAFCLHLVLTLSDAHEHLVAAVAPLLHVRSEDDERHSHTTVVVAHRLQLEVVADAHDEIVCHRSPFVLTTDRVAHGEPFVLLHGSLVEHVGTRLHVSLVEVATLQNLQSHSLRILIVAGQHLQRHLMLIVATSPTHILVACADGALREAHALHERQLLQFGAYRLALRLRLFREFGVEHLVLVEAVVAAEDVVRLARHDTYIYSEHESHAELHRHYRQTQLSAARRESERSFQHQSRSERCAVERRHNSRQRSHDKCRHSHDGGKKPVCREADVARNELHARLAALERHYKQNTDNQSHEGEQHALHYHLKAQTAYRGSHHTACVDAAHTHRHLGEREVEQIEQGDEQHKDRSHGEHVDKAAVALVLRCDAREIDVVNGGYSELHLLVKLFLVFRTDAIGFHEALFQATHYLFRTCTIVKSHIYIVAPLAPVGHSALVIAEIHAVGYGAVVGHILAHAHHGDGFHSAIVGVDFERLASSVRRAEHLLGCAAVNDGSSSSAP